MTTRCEEVESKSIADLKEEHCGAKMRDDQQPSLFIVQMERLKIKMEEKVMRSVMKTSSWTS